MRRSTSSARAPKTGCVWDMAPKDSSNREIIVEFLHEKLQLSIAATASLWQCATSCGKV